MTWYEYQCAACFTHLESQEFRGIGRMLRPCTCGEGVFVRMASIPNTTPIACTQPYFNHTVGQYVTGSRDFEQKLAEGSKKMSERLGYDQSFTPVYPGEAKEYNEKVANDDKQSGESVERYRRLNNQTEPARTIIV